ncbi:2Fe-2S iron-sulfur cluster binding domain-containing protein [Bradyrhizobium sp. 200]|uniref:2Fe-2S iron-sulfur cluster-binding protein n=1 Tax=Bradyrhizobium sp. 200 TaxID=2782665 RepID=UPI001FFF1450|nr:2Fe-2S iron-sulfur cluster-binding protein [Bradyrhizobium sp. 200]UPJ48509.1 2Fe-2S iron-sulfur cluster binding domain-containing protein [Bradyrhizobium sp. 200]
MTFTVHVAGSELSFPCEPREFVLDAAERAGYSMPSSCRKGVCNTCETALLSGEVEQRGKGRRTARDGSALVCRAQPRADLTIRPKRFERIDIFRRKTITATVYRLVRPAPDVTILMLRFPIGLRAPFKAGQYLQVVMEDGDRRNFSMANAARHNDGAELHIRHVPNGKFSEKILSGLAVGDRLQVEIPHGDFHLRVSPRPVILLASGTGFAPIKSIVETAIRAGNERPMHLYWGARTREDIYLFDLAANWQRRLHWFSFTPVLSDAAASWPGRTGLVHNTVREDHRDLSGVQVYACGNPKMVDAAQRDFTADQGLPEAEFFADAFVDSGPSASYDPQPVSIQS